MGLRGDLRSVNLGDLLQSMASRRHTGVLEVQTDQKRWLISLRSGEIIGLSADPPRDIWRRLVLTGLVTEAQLREAIRRARRGKAVPALLIQRRSVKAEVLRRFFEELVFEQFHEIFSLRRGILKLGEKEFVDDKNWTALSLTLPVTTVLMECARRTDHWERVCRHIAGPGTVLLADPRADRRQECIEGSDDDGITRSILEQVAPDRSIGEIADSLPFSRVEVFTTAAELVKSGVLRTAGADELVQLAETTEDLESVVSALLQAHREEPANAAVLTDLVDALARAGKQKELPTYLKILGNVHLEAGREEEAVSCLRRAWESSPNDPSPGEKLFQLRVKRRELDKAEKVASGLIRRYRELGMNEAWRSTAQALVEARGSRPDLVAELGRAELAMERKRRATKLLHQAGRAFLKADNLPQAAACYEDLARIVPNSKKVKETLEAIRQGTVQEKRRRRTRIAVAACAAVFAVCLILFTGYEAHARARFLTLTCEVVESGLETDEQIENAIRRLDRFRAQYRGTVVSLLDAPRLLEELKEKQVEKCLQPPEALAE